MSELKIYPYLDTRGILGLRAGDDFVLSLKATNGIADAIITLTGYSATLQLRDAATDALLLADDSITGSITIDGAGGVVNFATPATLTALVPAGVCKYGLRMVGPDGKGDTLLSGPCDVAPRAVY
jgi:hypothetical protein